MKTSRSDSGFALAVTLVLMALVVTVIVAYLANTGSDRSTSAIYANRIRSKIVAEDGLAAATKLLSDNTRYGNYITAMPAPSLSPARLYTEIYRPTDAVDTTTAIANDYLKLTNAAGEHTGFPRCYSVRHAPNRSSTHSRHDSAKSVRLALAIQAWRLVTATISTKSFGLVATPRDAR